MLNSIQVHSYKSPVGNLLLGEYKGKLCLCDWEFRKQRSAIDKRVKDGLNAEFEYKLTPFLQSCIDQLDAYFAGELKEFVVPVLLVGTDFQQQVWEALRLIPYGKTSSYLELSEQLGNKLAIRAVASANGANALSIIIPCHRIIGSDGDLTGYAGGLEAKKKLLSLEKALNQLELF